MGTLDVSSLPEGALLLLDSAPVIYVLEQHQRFAQRFLPLFEAHAAGHLRFAVTTIAIAEILTGPLKRQDEPLVRRYRSVFEAWQVVELTSEIAEASARLRASLRLRTIDAVQAASALSINAVALITHDRDFSRFHSLPVIS